MSVIDQFTVDGQTAVVTGAAQGLGREMAIALAEAGADIAIADIDRETAAETAETVKDEGEQTDTIDVLLDVTDEESVETMIDEVTDTLGPIDILVNNAGVAANAPAESMGFDQWQRVIETNLSGVFLCSKHVGQQMLERERGQIINIASMSAYNVNVPQPQVGYNASKAGVVMVTKSMAVEWANRGVRVNAIAPGYMRTDLVDEVLADDPSMEETWLANTPMRRLGRPEELGAVVVFLASDASSYMTGEVLVYDGGYTSR